MPNWIYPSCLLVLLCNVALVHAQDESIWTVNGRYIELNGTPFTFKGVNYSPVPIGASQDEDHRGDVFTKKYNYIYERDIPILRDMNVNSIRIYNCYAWRFPGPDMMLPSNDNLNDHTDFLDQLWNSGSNPIYVWITHHMENTFHTLIYDELKDVDEEHWELDDGRAIYLDPVYSELDNVSRVYNSNVFINLASRYGNHPAVVGFVIGNEQNSESTREMKGFWDYYNSIAKKVKAIAPNKLTMISIVDDANFSVSNAERIGRVGYIDVWGINSYRGTSEIGFDVLFTEYAELSNKPLLITEYGPPASTRDSDGEVIILENNAERQADYIEVHWNDIVDHRGIVSGGYIFAWTDEWWKAGQPDVHNAGENLNEAFPGSYGDEEYFGMNGVKKATNSSKGNNSHPIADILIPRASVGRMTEVFSREVIVGDPEPITDIGNIDINNQSPDNLELPSPPLKGRVVNVGLSPTGDISSAIGVGNMSVGISSSILSGLLLIIVMSYLMN